MDKKEKSPFRKGDILKNNYAGEENPVRFVMFLKCGTIRQGRYTSKSYDCIGYDGSKIQFFRDDHQLEVVGHIDEYDAFLSALKRLKGWMENGG